MARKPTREEQKIIDTAWGDYLANTANPSISQAVSAWKTYNDILKKHNVISTLCGYMVQDNQDAPLRR